MARLTGVYAMSTLGAACAIGDDHIRITGGQGRRFPAAGDYMLRIGRGPTFEIVRATSRDEDTIYLLRAQDDTEAISHPPGTPVWCVISHSYVSELWKQSDDMTLALGILEGDIIEGLTVAPADSPDNALLRDAVGNKKDAAVTAPGDTKSALAYLKGLLTILGVPERDIDAILGSRWDSGGDLGTDIASILSSESSLVTRLGDPDGDALNSLTAKVGDLPRSLSTILGSRWDSTNSLGNDIASVLAALAVAAKDATENTHMYQVVGNKTDDAASTAAVNKSAIAYLKGLLGILGVPARSLDAILGARWDSSGDLGTDIAALLTSLGNADAHIITSVVAKLGDIGRSLDAIIGARWDSSGDLGTDVAGMIASDTTIKTRLGDPDAHNLNSITAKIGNLARDLDAIIGSRWNSSGNLGTDVAALLAAMMVAGKDSIQDDNMQHVIGNKEDTPVYATAATKSALGYLKGLLGINVIARGTFTTSSATVPADTGRSEGNDYFKGCTLIPLAGGCAFQPRPIRQYTATTDVFILDEPFTTAPGLVDYAIVDKGYPVQRLLDIFSVVNSIMQLEETGGTVTTDGNEQTIYINDAPAILYRPVALYVDLTAMDTNDDVTVKVYYRLKAGGDYILHTQEDYADNVSPDLKIIPLYPNRFGIKITVQETAGVHNDIDWGIIYEG